MRRSTMPVRSRIHSSEVSTMFSRSALVRIRSGTYMPVPEIVAPRTGLSRADMVGKNLLADVLVHPLLHETRQRADGAAERLGSAGAVADEAHAVHSQERRGPVLLPVDLGLEPAQRRQHEHRSQARQQVPAQFLAHLVRQEA